MTELILGKVKQQIIDANKEYTTSFGYTLHQILLLSRYKGLRAKVRNVFNIADNLLPEHKSYFKSKKFN